MITRTKGRLRLCIALLTMNLVFIWGNSLLPGEVSGALSHWLKDILSNLLPIKPPGADGGHGLLRKIAHFTEFGCLGACLSWLVRMLKEKTFSHYGLPLAGGFLAACIDETIQCFVPDRGPGVLDVCIDTAGVLTGIIFFGLVYFLRKKEKLSLED